MLQDHIKISDNTLHTLIRLRTDLKNDIQALGQQLVTAKTASEKNDIQAQLDKLEVDLQTTTHNLRGIGAGADIASLRAAQETKFSLQEELFALIRPALKEMKDMTSHVRLKSELKDKIAYYREKQPVAELAVANIMGLIDKNEDESLERYLEGMLADWRKQLTVIQSELQSAGLQLEKLERSEASLAEASQSYLKAFFQRRGLYLAQAILAVMGILLLSRMSYRAMVKLIPGYRQEQAAQPACRFREGQCFLAGHRRDRRLRWRAGRLVRPPATHAATLVCRGLQRIWLGDTVHPVNLARGRSREYLCPPSRPAVNAGSLAAVSQPRVPMLPQYGGILKNRRVGLQPRVLSR